MRNIDTYPQLPQNDTYDKSLIELIKQCNGFVYEGDRTEGIIAAVKVLRTRPDLATILLEDQ